MHKYDVFLIILGICGVFALGAGDLVIALFFSIIGIPIGFLVLALPSLALILCAARVIDRLFLGHFFAKGVSGYVAVGLVLASLASLSFIANARQMAEIQALSASDHDDLTRPLPDQTYALLSKDTGETCTELCQRLLLTGQARAVMLGQADAQTVPTANTPATMWHFKDQPSCPTVALSTGGGLFIPGEENAVKADVRMGDQIAAGHCLIATPATLAAAEAVILDVTLRTQARDASYSLGMDQISATRRSVWLKTDQGFVEQARWTYVSAQQMFALALPMVDTNMNSQNHSGFWRGPGTNTTYAPSIAAFVVDSLGLRLGLSDLPPVKTASGEDPLIAALNAAGPLDSNTQHLAITRLDAIFRAKTTTAYDRALLLALLSDPRTVLSWQYEAATRTLLRTAPPDFSATVAEIGFARLASTLLPDQQPQTRKTTLSREAYSALLQKINLIKDQITTLSTLLAILPDAALQPHREAIFALAQDPANRLDAYPLIARLSAFGDKGAVAMLGLLADPHPDERSGFKDWRDIQRSALRGLCGLGPGASKFLPQVVDLAKDGKMFLSSDADGRLAAITLLRLGHPTAGILDLAQLARSPIHPQTLENLVQQLARPSPCEP